MATRQDIIDTFRSIIISDNVIPEDLEDKWLKDSTISISVMLEEIIYTPNTTVIEDGAFSRVPSDIEGQLIAFNMKVKFLTQKISGYSTLINISTQNASLSGIPTLKQEATKELSSTKEDIELWYMRLMTDKNV